MIVILQPSEEHYKRALESAGYRVGIGDLAQYRDDDTAIAFVNVENAVVHLKVLERKFSRVRPVLIGDPAAFLDSTDLSLCQPPL